MNFDLLTIDEFGRLDRGRSRHRPRDDQSLYGGIYPFIQTGDVKHAPLYITSYSQTYNENGLAQSRLWKRGTLCITIAANIADTAILDIDACFPDSILGFTPSKGKSSAKFIKYCFDVYKTTLEAISKGTTQDNLSLDKIRKVKFKIPSLQAQRKIAAVLSAYDDLIENNSRRISKLEKIAEELYHEWFVRLRFPGYEKVKIIKGVPEGWEIKKITEINDFQFLSNNLKPFSEQKLYYATADVDGIEVLSSNEVVDYANRPSRAQNQPELHSVWFARMKNTYKILFFSESNSNLQHQMIFSSGFAGFLTKKEIFPFLFLTIKSKWFHEIKDMYATGATQESLTNYGLDQIKLIVPKLGLLELFGSHIYQMIASIHQLQYSSKILSTTRNRLLSRLMSGKIDVEQLDIQFPQRMQEEISADA